MKIDQHATYDAILSEIGHRLASLRLSENLTQAALAEKAGVGVRTVQRLETGEAATQLSGFIRVCRALGLADRLDGFIPEASTSPMAMLERGKSGRRRASSAGPASPAGAWTWGDER